MSHARTLQEYLSPDAMTEVQQWLVKYPPAQKRSAIIPILHIVQREYGGSLTSPLLDAVADFLDIPHIAAYEVASFYSMFHLDPVGNHVIAICTNIACMLNDSDSIVRYAQERLGIKLGETTPDGKITLKEVECLAACGGAPACQIGQHYHENLTKEKMAALIDTLYAGT